MKSLFLAVILVSLFSQVALADTKKVVPSEPSTKSYTKERNVLREEAYINPGVQADDQSNDRSQLELIAQIRHEITSAEDFSVAAQNVTIVSNGESRVILRGDVPSAAEKSRLIGIARKHASQVQDELVIKG